MRNMNLKANTCKNCINWRPRSVRSVTGACAVLQIVKNAPVLVTFTKDFGCNQWSKKK